jgi:hypothetical protein
MTRTHITRPTIATMQALFTRLLDEGWHPDQQIQISNLRNVPEMFMIQAVERWIGEPSLFIAEEESA